MTSQESNSAQCVCCAASYRSVILRLSNSFYKTEIDMKNRLTKKLRCLRRDGSTMFWESQAIAAKGYNQSTDDRIAETLQQAYRRDCVAWVELKGIYSSFVS